VSRGSPGSTHVRVIHDSSRPRSPSINSVQATGSNPERSRYNIMRVLRQTLEAAVRWGYMGKNPAKLAGRPGAAFALNALDALSARLDTPLLFPAPEGGLLNLDNWRRRQWGPAVEAAGVRTPARIYDLRSTFASNALRPVSRCSSWRGSWAPAWRRSSAPTAP
jgi:hypothetical protein